MESRWSVSVSRAAARNCWTSTTGHDAPTRDTRRRHGTRCRETDRNRFAVLEIKRLADGLQQKAVVVAACILVCIFLRW